jgi:arsenate reductase-like glutaredoxin family protein
VLSQGTARVHERRYFTDKPTPEELRQLAALLPGGVRDLVAPRSSRLKELGIRPEEMDEEALIELLAREPKLLRRPIVTDGRRVVVGLDRAAIAELANG